jgi:predicted CXXCH cytochrome family protein
MMVKIQHETMFTVRRTTLKKVISATLLFVIYIIVVIFISNISERPAYGEANCLSCHEALSKGKVVHPALQMGCTTCHSAIDANELPHKKTSKTARGLSSEQPDLCYGCHDKAKFTQKNVHAAIGMGCTSCHNPHSSKNAKLLNAEPPGLCFNCHDKAGFSKKNVHPPVAGGMCMSCHTPHSSNEIALLLKPVNDVCITCHTASDIRRGIHIVRGFSTRGHPVKGKKDKMRPDRDLSCSSCHNPHSSDWIKLFRYEANSPFVLCLHCHPK